MEMAPEIREGLIMVSGPYKYEGDIHTSFRIDSHDRIIASVYASDGDEDGAEKTADRIATLLMSEPDGWASTKEAPCACHVIAARFDSDCGEWVYAVVLSPPIHPFTHWQHLPTPPERP